VVFAKRQRGDARFPDQEQRSPRRFERFKNLRGLGSSCRGRTHSTAHLGIAPIEAVRERPSRVEFLFLDDPTYARKMDVVLNGVIEHLLCRLAEGLRRKFLGVLADSGQLVRDGVHQSDDREKDEGLHISLLVSDFAIRLRTAPGRAPNGLRLTRALLCRAILLLDQRGIF
jgi:hypothetical protein